MQGRQWCILIISFSLQSSLAMLFYRTGSHILAVPNISAFEWRCSEDQAEGWRPVVRLILVFAVGQACIQAEVMRTERHDCVSCVGIGCSQDALSWKSV